MSKEGHLSGFLNNLSSVVGSPGRKKRINMRQRQPLLTNVHVFLFFLGTLHFSPFLVVIGARPEAEAQAFLTFCVHVSLCVKGSEGRAEMNLGGGVYS